MHDSNIKITGIGKGPERLRKSEILESNAAAVEQQTMLTPTARKGSMDFFSSEHPDRVRTNKNNNLNIQTGNLQ